MLTCFQMTSKKETTRSLHKRTDRTNKSTFTSTFINMLDYYYLGKSALIFMETVSAHGARTGKKGKHIKNINFSQKKS